MWPREAGESVHVLGTPQVVLCVILLTRLCRQLPQTAPRKTAICFSAGQASGRTWAWHALLVAAGSRLGRIHPESDSLMCLAVGAGVWWALGSSHMGVRLGFLHGAWAQGQASRKRTEERGF